MIIKVCGVRDPDNIRQIDELGCVDWMGFIFFPPSSRNVEHVPNYLPQHCKRVGVFVNATPEDIQHRQEEFGFDLIQLHGDETPDECQALRSLLKEGTKLIKMIQVESAQELEKTKQYEGKVDYFLFETKCKGYGGSGKQFDWDILQHYKGPTPFLLTGGIGPQDAEKVQAFFKSQTSKLNLQLGEAKPQTPQCIGIDLNSKFEIAPALKDSKQIKEFVQIVQSNNK